MQIQHGTATVACTPSGTQWEIAVTFQPTFSSTPRVICSLGDSGPGKNYAYLSGMAYSVTANGFKAIVKTIGDNKAAPGNVGLDWLAILD